MFSFSGYLSKYKQSMRSIYSIWLIENICFYQLKLQKKNFPKYGVCVGRLKFWAKVNDNIFKNSWKIPFFGHFWPFYGHFRPNQKFSVKIRQRVRQGALIPCQISQKANASIPTKLTLLKRQNGEQKDGGKMDRRMDGKTDWRIDRPFCDG